MYFRLKILLCIFLLSSCSLKLNEAPAPTSGMNVTPVKQGCLANSGAVLNKFADGEISEADLDAYWNCLNKSVELFYGNTKSLHNDYYDPQEFVGFLEKYFLNNRKIQPALVAQAMRLKQGLMGGRTDQISKEEFLRIMSLIKTVHGVSQRLRPYMPLGYNDILKRSLTNDQLEETLKTFQESMGVLGQALENSLGEYSFDEFAALVTEMKIYMYGIEAKDTWADATITKLALIKAAKSVLIAPPAITIQKEDWPRLFYLVPRYASHAIRVMYYMQSPKDYLHGIGLERMEKMLLDSAELLETAVNNHPEQRIEKKEMEDLWNSFDWKSMADSPLSKYAKQDSFEVINKFLLGRIFVDNEYPGAITKNNLAKMKENFIYWIEGLHAIEMYYREKHGELEFASKALSRDQFSNSLKEKLNGFTRQKLAVSKEAVEDIIDSARDVKTVFPDRHSLVFIPASKEFDQLSYPHMIKLHTLNTVNRILWAVYAGGRTLSEKELQAMGADLSPMLKSIGINIDIAAQIKPRVFEASLFLYSSDGLLTINKTEALEMEALLISTFDRAGNIHKEIASDCKPFTQKISTICYRTKFLLQVKKYWDYIPGLAKHADSLNDNAQIHLFEQLNSFLRKGRTQAAYEASDTRAFVLLPYYIDILFSRFDKNGDGKFDDQEAKLAFPVFQPFIAEKAKAFKITEEKDLRSVFTFILAQQKLPNEAKVKYFLWRAGEQKFSVGRGEIVAIFAKLMSL